MGPGLHPQQLHSVAAVCTHSQGFKAGDKAEQGTSELSASGGVTPNSFFIRVQRAKTKGRRVSGKNSKFGQKDFVFLLYAISV